MRRLLDPFPHDSCGGGSSGSTTAPGPAASSAPIDSEDDLRPRQSRLPRPLVRVLLSLTSLSTCFSIFPTPAEAKVTTGSVWIGGDSPEERFVYLGKMGYDIGDGTYSVRFKVIRPPLSYIQNVDVAVFLDEDWEQNSLETMEPVGGLGGIILAGEDGRGRLIIFVVVVGAGGTIIVIVVLGPLLLS